MRFFLFFLASAMAAGPLVRVTRASVVDFGSDEGSDSIVAGVEVVGEEGEYWVWDILREFKHHGVDKGK